MSYETILSDTDRGVAILTLNRPHRLNAWTHQMHAELFDAITLCNDDPDIGAIVVTGAGRGFCAGADIRDNFQARIDGESQALPGDWVGLVRSSKPMIAAVNGASVGVGATMVLPMDIIIASDQAKFGMFFVKMGVTPELASSHFLVQRMGMGRASEMCLTGRLYSGQEAFDAGLADRVVPHDKLMDEALETARLIAANPAPQLRWIKELLTANGSETDIAAVQRREGEALQKAYATPEHTEAVNAFLEKRPPNFRRA
ncbi:MAG: enoyl-CoA hydratase-related protein [Gammaproteobacteria bacterium]|nr:enoyl-CoA hydratase-related protein [Gammaproteobacteria bacterium]